MPSIGTSDQVCPVGSLGIARPCQPCVGSDVLETATRMSFGTNGFSDEVANQCWLTGSTRTSVLGSWATSCLTIQLDQSHFHDFTSVIDNATPDGRGGTLINDPSHSGNTIDLLGVNIANLLAKDFFFV